MENKKIKAKIFFVRITVVVFPILLFITAGIWSAFLIINFSKFSRTNYSNFNMYTFKKENKIIDGTTDPVPILISNKSFLLSSINYFISSFGFSANYKLPTGDEYKNNVWKIEGAKKDLKLYKYNDFKREEGELLNILLTIPSTPSEKFILSISIINNTKNNLQNIIIATYNETKKNFFDPSNIAYYNLIFYFFVNNK